MERKVSSILLTAAPGVGKTTIVKNLVEIFKDNQIKCKGFYTEEVRLENGSRCGFDVVDVTGKRGILARHNPIDDNIKRPQVGKYTVYIKDFEEIALPQLKIEPNTILIIDEIGKMELLSTKFKERIQEIPGKAILLATMPNKDKSDVIQKIKAHPNSLILEITKKNRNQMVEEVYKRTIQIPPMK